MKLYLQIREGSKIRIKNPLKVVCARLTDSYLVFDRLYSYYSKYFETLDRLRGQMIGPVEEDQRLSYWYKFDIKKLGGLDFLLVLTRRSNDGKSWEAVDELGPDFVWFLNRI